MNLTVALALVFALGTHAIKGVALAVPEMGDLDLLNAETWLNWSETGGVPMTYGVPSKCAPVLIVSNEPNAIAPYGAPMYPVWYAQLVKQVRARCPDAMLVIGNVSADDWRSVGGQKRGYEWLAELLPMVKDSNVIVGAHCYSITAWWCIEQLREIKKLAPRGLWVTEYGITSGDPRELKLFMQWLDRNAEVTFIFTNRQRPCGGQFQGWAIDDKVSLVDTCTGQLTPMGKVFAEFNK